MLRGLAFDWLEIVGESCEVGQRHGLHGGGWARGQWLLGQHAQSMDRAHLLRRQYSAPQIPSSSLSTERAFHFPSPSFHSFLSQSNPMTNKSFATAFAHSR